MKLNDQTVSCTFFFFYILLWFEEGYDDSSPIFSWFVLVVQYSIFVFSTKRTARRRKSPHSYMKISCLFKKLNPFCLEKMLKFVESVESG